VITDRKSETEVLVTGAGPVGLTLALDLARRGIDVTVAERRPARAATNIRCNQISARSMEIFRLLGIARMLREAGLPADYPNDVASRITVTGVELSRVTIPSRAQRYIATCGPDTCWPTPEPPHRVNQMYFEPLLSAYAAAQPRIRMLNTTAVADFTQTEQEVVARVRNLETGADLAIGCSYLVGCDGGKSTVRKAIGSRLEGTPVIQGVQSTCIRAPGLPGRIPGRRAWMYLSLNPRRCGTTIAIDGLQTWLIHDFLYRGEQDFEAVDRDFAIRAILGVGSDFVYEVISKKNWCASRLVADRFRDRRVFLCGDAAHLWIPHAGYGMNAGIADAANLSWLMAATLNGWASPSILDAYEAERRPIAEQVSSLIMDLGLAIMEHRRSITPEIERSGPAGDAERARIGKAAYEIDVQEQCCGGLNFGYSYTDSPIIAYDGEPPPAYTVRHFLPSTVPGCRTPHFWLKDRRSLYDALGIGYTLVRFNCRASSEGLLQAAAQRGVPVTVVDVDAPEVRALYDRNLVLVRPDQHVAWRGNKEPSDPMWLIDLVRGSRSAKDLR
jgi:2-polyprenyl-6-methoxyphenol hydroxylase-like FAD-dependent oxidoreductase